MSLVVTPLGATRAHAATKLEAPAEPVAEAPAEPVTEAPAEPVTDHSSSWDTTTPTTGATPVTGVEPAPSAQPASIVAPAPIVAPPPPPDPVLQRRRKVASGFAIAGATFMGAGGFAWIFLAAPAAIAAQVAEDRAQDGALLVSESELYSRAENRRRFARISFWSGLGGVAVGGIMLGAGLGIKAKTEREMSQPRAGARLHVRPTFTPYGAGATLVLRH